VPIEGLRPGAVIGAGTDLAGGRVFVLHDTGGRRLLTALRPEGEGFTLAFQIPVPPRSMLALDGESHRPSLLAVRRRAFQVLALGAEPPLVPPFADEPPLVLVPRTRQFGMVCNEIEGPRPAAVARWVRETSEVNKVEIGRMLRGLVQRGDPGALCDFARALEVNGDPVEASEIAAYAFRHHPDHALARLQAARLPASSGAWAKVLELLEGRTDAGLEGHAARHFGHLLGLALMDAGRHDEALPVLLRAIEHEGPCELEALIALASAGDEVDGEIPARRGMRELLRVIAAADARLSSGDAAGAIELLDDAVVWEARDVQSMGRFARAFLSAGDDLPPALQTRKLFALATYAELHRDRSSNRREIFLRDRWNADVLDALQAEATAWLDAFTSRSTIETPHGAPDY
jgi:tetratricopeptide (TPR) repeat protein